MAQLRNQPWNEGSTEQDKVAPIGTLSTGVNDKKAGWDASEVERVMSQEEFEKDHQDYSRMDVRAKLVCLQR